MDLNKLSGVKLIPAPGSFEIRLTSGSGAMYMLKTTEEDVAKGWVAALTTFQESYAAKAKDGKKFFDDATQGCEC
jgi:hypothetical protein